MKPIKTLPILIFLLVMGNAKAQFFPDSLVVTGVQYFATVSPGYPFDVHFYRDSVQFDSANGADEFYTVYKRTASKSVIVSNSIYKMRVNNKRVYITGTVHYGQPISLTDKLIYDYNHTIGDTFTVRLNNDTLLDIKFRVDSIKLMMYQDGIKRITHYYTVKQGSRTLDGPFFSGEGMGSFGGLIYLKADGNFPDFYWNKLVSVCKPDQIIYGNKNCNIGNYQIQPSCEEDSLKMELQRAEWAGIIESNAMSSVNVYPNPTAGLLTIATKLKGTFSFMDNAGKICMKDIPFTEGEQTIDISGMKTGIYLLFIQSAEGVIVKKICVSNNQ